MIELSAIARPYAKAAFEFANEKDLLNNWNLYLETLTNFVSEKKIKDLLINPAVSKKEQLELFSCFDSPLGGKEFLDLLIQERRLKVLPKISELFYALKLEVEKVLEVDLLVSENINDSEVSKIKLVLENKFKKTIKLKIEQDPSILGGAIVRTDDMVIDGSVKGKLAKLASSILEV